MINKFKHFLNVLFATLSGILWAAQRRQNDLCAMLKQKKTVERSFVEVYEMEYREAHYKLVC